MTTEARHDAPEPEPVPPSSEPQPQESRASDAPPPPDVTAEASPRTGWRSRRRWVGIGAAAAIVVLAGGGGAAVWARNHRAGAFGLTDRSARAGAATPHHESGDGELHRGDRGGRNRTLERGPSGVVPMPGRPRFGPGTGPPSMPGPWGQPPAAVPAPPSPPNPAQAAPAPAATAAPMMGALSQAQLGKVAASLGIPASDLERDLRGGKTLATIGQERGKTREEVRSAVIDAMIDAR